LADTVSLSRFVAAGFGSGWLPKAPGTWGSLASLIPAVLVLQWCDASAVLVGSLLLLALGCVACYHLLPTLIDKDPGWIVIDEWAGQWLCLALITLLVGHIWLAAVVSFIAFRLFDITKPWPVSACECIGPPWWSIMADDMAAGLGGAAAVALLYAAWRWVA